MKGVSSNEKAELERRSHQAISLRRVIASAFFRFLLGANAHPVMHEKTRMVLSHEVEIVAT